MGTINIEKERLVLTRIYRTISQRKPWNNSLKGSAEAQQPLLCRMWGCLQAHDSSASSSWTMECFCGEEMTEAANTVPEKLQTIPFFSLYKSLFTEGHRWHRHSVCTVTTKGLCGSTQLDRVVVLQHLPAASEKDTVQQPKCWYPLNSFPLTSEDWHCISQGSAKC